MCYCTPDNGMERCLWCQWAEGLDDIEANKPTLVDSYKPYLDKGMARVGIAECHDNFVCRDHFPKLPDTNQFSFPWFKETLPDGINLQDTFYQKVLMESPFTKILEEENKALCEYLGFKEDELRKIIANVNNFKLKDRFHSVQSISESKTDYFDGEFCFLTVYKGFDNFKIIKHWKKIDE
ncbi:hypothetical protein VPHG_00178 [Vibrio phage 11895-B1]|uniref:hypothetical protein n=1 Tax=Vibrio phage 11895-B1 TaxID=754075 RepID=UPI0002C13A3D|nr:hypothetical protein VPHG_00178 [Vibrio phage 11895-B1]AGH32241.1 hypothetical protein VPHG_00178 [Vibrio phage 11895-B1]